MLGFRVYIWFRDYIGFRVYIGFRALIRFRDIITLRILNYGNYGYIPHSGECRIYIINRRTLNSARTTPPPNLQTLHLNPKP